MIGPRLVEVPDALFRVPIDLRVEYFIRATTPSVARALVEVELETNGLRLDAFPRGLVVVGEAVRVEDET